MYFKFLNRQNQAYPYQSLEEVDIYIQAATNTPEQTPSLAQKKLHDVDRLQSVPFPRNLHILHLHLLPFFCTYLKIRERENYKNKLMKHILKQLFKQFE